MRCQGSKAPQTEETRWTRYWLKDEPIFNDEKGANIVHNHTHSADDWVHIPDFDWVALPPERFDMKHFEQALASVAGLWQRAAAGYLERRSALRLRSSYQSTYCLVALDS